MSRVRPHKRAKWQPPEFFRSHVIIHTHIEKTAGSTLTHGLRSAIGPGVWDIRDPRRERPEFLSVEEKDLICVLAGHFAYGLRDRYFERTPLYIACVRHPFERFRSAYDFVRARPDHPSYPRYEGRTFAQAVEDLITSPRKKFNGMSRVLTGSKAPDAGQLFRNVEEGYLIVSPHHRVNDTLDALTSLIGSPAIDRDLHRNKAPEPSSENIGALRNQFEEANALDVELAQFVEVNYDRWLAELPERLANLRRRHSS